MIQALAGFSLILPSILFAQNQCNTCQKGNYVACHNETAFSICIDDEATRNFIVCPKQYQCTDGIYVCYPNASSTATCANIPPGDSETSSTLYLSTSSSSTTYAMKESSTTTAPRDPIEMCQELQAQGFYPNEMDPTCTTYIFCQKNGDVLTYKSTMTCPNNQWFDATKQRCVSTKPDTCL